MTTPRKTPNAQRSTSNAEVGKASRAWAWMRKAGAACLWFLGKVFGFLFSFLLNRREFAIWPAVFGLVILLLAAAVFLATGRAVIASLDPVFNMLLKLFGILAVVGMVGAMKTNGYLLSDIDNENDPKTPWQKVASADFACVTLIVALSWLVLSA